jgi:hypothetical protein
MLKIHIYTVLASFLWIFIFINSNLHLAGFGVFGAVIGTVNIIRTLIHRGDW